MDKNYLTYPCDKVCISQGYTGGYSHEVNSTGVPCDYPIDDNHGDSKRDGWFYCPCDEMKLTRIYGVGMSASNTVWLESTSRVYLANGMTDYVTILVTHAEDEQLRSLRVGQVFHRGDKIFLEGKDGNATGNHFHISVATGKIKGTGWVKNSKGGWVLQTTGKAIKPEQAFYVDGFTKIVTTQGLTFRKLSIAASPQSAASVTYFPVPSYRGSSLADALDDVGASSSFAYRKQIATANKINGYVGSGGQNTKMLTLLKQGKLIKP